MKLLLLSLLTCFVSCAISEKSGDLDQYVFFKEEKKFAGSVSYMDVEHFRFKKMPKLVASEMIASKCKNGYEVLRKTRDIKSQTVGLMSVNNPWVTIEFQCN